jgi:hypothetical protein
MNIKQIYEFKLFDRRNEQLVIVHFRRIDDYFLIEKRTQDGKIIDSEKIEEQFAKIVLEQALISLPKSDLEITKFSDIKS